MNRLNEINANANIYNPAGVSTMQLISYAVEDASFLRLQTERGYCCYDKTYA